MCVKRETEEATADSDFCQEQAGAETKELNIFAVGSGIDGVSITIEAPAGARIRATVADRSYELPDNSTTDSPKLVVDGDTAIVMGSVDLP